MPFNEQLEWKPKKKQARFIAIPFSIREAVYGGGAGSGKTELLLMLPLIWGFHENPKFKQVLMRRTTKQLKKEVVPRSQDIYPKFGAVFNESDMVWTFPRPDQFGSGMKPTGARVFLGHCEHEKNVHDYDSMEINLYTPDEIQSLTKFMYDYIAFTRVRSSDPNLPAMIRGTGMPGDVGHTWVNKRFVKPFPQGGKIIVGKNGFKRMYVHATVDDNDSADPNYHIMLQQLNEAEKQAKLYGSWDAYLGQVFSEFRDKHHPEEPDNALHVIKPFNIPSWWPKIVSIDWGFKAKCSVGWAAISPTKKVYIYRHQHWYGKKISEWSPEVKFWIEKDKPAEIVICHSANQHRGDPHTILEQVSDALETSVTLGVKDRLAGKTLLHEYLRWEQRPKMEKIIGEYDPEIAAWILRNKSRSEYDLYISMYNQSEETEDIPRLLFFDDPDVELICNSLKSCSYPQVQKDGKAIEDVAEFDGDDEYDMLRGIIHAADSFFDMASDSQIKLNNINRVQEILANTNDVSGFYREMRNLEIREADEAKGFKLFHKSRRH
jgi:hypothetical protein